MRPRWKALLPLFILETECVDGACIVEPLIAISESMLGTGKEFFAPTEPTMMPSTLVCLEYRLNCVDQWLKLKPKTSSIDWYAAIVIRGGIRQSKEAVFTRVYLMIIIIILYSCNS